jgi:hypothetical protein
MAMESLQAHGLFLDRLYLLVALVTFTVEACKCVHTLMSTLVNFHLGALIYITMKRFITVIRAV